MILLDKKRCLLALLMLHQGSAFSLSVSRHTKASVPTTREDASPTVQRRRTVMGSATIPSSGRMKGSPLDSNEATTDGEKKAPHTSAHGTAPTTSRSRPTLPLEKSLKIDSASIPNPFQGDAPFLRKRTRDLMRITAPDTSNAERDFLSRDMKINRKTFNFLIGAWAYSGEPDAPEQAMALLRRMEELHNLSRTHAAEEEEVNGGGGGGEPPRYSVSPDVRSYTKAMNAVARSNRPDAGSISEGVLKRMIQLHSKGINETVRPNTFTYKAVVEAYVNSGLPEKAEEFCKIMLEQYLAGEPDIVPTTKTFNMVMQAYSKDSQWDAAYKVEQLLSEMENLYANGLEEARPNFISYNILISAWANCPEEGSEAKAEAVLKRMEELAKHGDYTCRPDTVSFNAVIDAYAKSGLPDAAQHAEQILIQLDNCGYENVQPNTRSFNSILNAWAKSGDFEGPVRAEGMLDRMLRLDEAGYRHVGADSRSFCTVITAWARSRRPGKAENADRLFRQMEEFYKAGDVRFRPNVVAVNAVLNACAYSSELDDQNRAMEIANTRMRELEKGAYGNPDQVTYGTFLKVYANLMPDCEARRQITDLVFKKCKRDGQVGSLVLQQLQVLAPPALYEALTGHTMFEEITVDDLPAAWRANVVEGKWNRERLRRQE